MLNFAIIYFSKWESLTLQKKSADSQLVEYLSVADSVWKTN